MKVASAIVLAIVLFVCLILIGPWAWNYVAPAFGLPQLTVWQFFQLTVWQFFVAGVACRCLLGTAERSK